MIQISSPMEPVLLLMLLARPCPLTLQLLVKSLTRASLRSLTPCLLLLLIQVHTSIIIGAARSCCKHLLPSHVWPLSLSLLLLDG
jgi:hypothetical protein